MEGRGRSSKVTILTFWVRKVIGGGWVVVACRIIVSAPVPFPFLWTFDFEFGTWIWDLDLGPGFGTWIWDLDLGLDLGLTIFFTFFLDPPPTKTVSGLINKLKIRLSTRSPEKSQTH